MKLIKISKMLRFQKALFSPNKKLQRKIENFILFDMESSKKVIVQQ
jgi:hypothetical protein